MQTSTTPQIYVACLASYNAGKLHGKWIDLDGGILAESFIFESIQEILNSSPEPGAEEWAVHDYSDFPNLGEYPQVSELVKVAKLIEEHGAAFSAALDYAGGNVEHATEMAENCFRGCFDRLRDFAESQLEEHEAYDKLGDLACYIDLDHYAHSLECEYNCLEHGGSIYVFDYC
jgi:antirestriction protein